MTPEERRLHLSALRDDLSAELTDAEKKYLPLENAYNRAMQHQGRIKEQLRQIDNALNWFKAHNDPQPPEQEADEPIPF